jgi:hypothetical protein
MPNTPVPTSPSACGLEQHPQGFTLLLDDGSAIVVPWEVTHTLTVASCRDRYACELAPDQTTVQWPRLGLTILVSGLYARALAGSGIPGSGTPVFVG